MSGNDSPYDVALPASGLVWENIGLFERYSTKLIGRLDQRWLHSYQRIVASSNLRRFRLDAATASISFLCLTTDGPVKVMETLEVLKGLLERVNREASLAPYLQTLSLPRPSSRGPLGSHPPAGEPPAGRERRQKQARYFLIERRRGKAHIYHRLVLLALLAIIFLVIW